jgi:hypothetical protein
MTSATTEVSETPKFKSASMNMIESQASSLSGIYVYIYIFIYIYKYIYVYIYIYIHIYIHD